MVYVADPALQKLEPCSKDFTSYLEAKYTCLSGNARHFSPLVRLLAVLVKRILAFGIDMMYAKFWSEIILIIKFCSC